MTAKYSVEPFEDAPLWCIRIRLDGQGWRNIGAAVNLEEAAVMIKRHALTGSLEAPKPPPVYFDENGDRLVTE